MGSSLPSTRAVNMSVVKAGDAEGGHGGHHHHQHHKQQHDAHNNNNPNANDEEDAGTEVSSLTAGFDQEIVEELHQALTELRAELEASRAEAARAVKVAEQAIQSAESCSSNDWNSTVTHKAAEAAAQAQKRSAEAMARQRLAEERLAGERRSAAFWRRQAEAAEEEAGALQTRAAAAEVQRAAMAEELESERRKVASYIAGLKRQVVSQESIQREALDTAMDRSRALEIELDGTRRDLTAKNEEAKTLLEALTETKSVSSEASKNNGSVRKRMSRIGHRKKKGPPGSESHRPTLSTDRSASALLLNLESPSSSSYYKDTQGGQSGAGQAIVSAGSAEPVAAETVLKLHAEAASMRTQFEVLRRATADELRSLPLAAKEWANQAARALTSSQSEIGRLRQKLALESATRRKLLHEVQDLRGTVRVYCRPRPPASSLPPQPASSPKSSSGGAAVAGGTKSAASASSSSIVSVPAHETLLLHRERAVSSPDGVSNTSPMSFEFDRVFAPESPQSELYSEMEELVLGVLDGYNVCLLAYGQTGSGKTHTMLGDRELLHEEDEGGVSDAAPRIVLGDEHGIHLQSVRQLFTIAERRNERYQDSFSITIVEVHDERLCDLVAGTEMAESRGQMRDAGKGDVGYGSSSRRDKNNFGSSDKPGGSRGGSKTKLEIRMNYDGDTVVQGLVSIPVHSFDDVCAVWEESLTARARRLGERGVDVDEYEAKSHVIATVHVISTNIATGVGTVGKIQFVDLAGSDLVPRSSGTSGKKSSSSSRNSASDGLLAGVGNNNEWKFANKSLATLSDVVNARCQFLRSVPYRNSTLTHLLRDSLEADTKVLLVVCVSSEAKDLQETASALRFASRMRRVTIGKATKHTVSLA